MGRGEIKWREEGLDGIRGMLGERGEVPAWVRMFEEETELKEQISRSPEESRKRLISHIIDLCPEADEKVLLKMV